MSPDRDLCTQPVSHQAHPVADAVADETPEPTVEATPHEDGNIAFGRYRDGRPGFFIQVSAPGFGDLFSGPLNEDEARAIVADAARVFREAFGRPFDA